MVLCVRLYSGWSYIADRLKSDKIVFEESGWYDGAVADKTKQAAERDKLLYTLEVAPVVENLKSLTLGLAVAFCSSAVAFGLIASLNPMFDQYSQSTLKLMVGNDKLANIAAERSTSGQPTYCDARYYKALAGGNMCK